MPHPEIIGTLAGANVLLDRENRSLIIEAERPMKFPIDHPYIQGTKLEKDAREALERPPFRINPDAICRFDDLKTDTNDCCLRCGAADGEDCRDI